MDEFETSPVLGQITSEFYLWLWWKSERGDGEIRLGGALGAIDMWVDERLVFSTPGQKRSGTVLVGDDPGGWVEARAALWGGKVLNEVRVGLRKEDREYLVTLRGEDIKLASVRLPAGRCDTIEDIVFERLSFYEELHLIVSALFHQFAEERTSPSWKEEVETSIFQWVSEGIVEA